MTHDVVKSTGAKTQGCTSKCVRWKAKEEAEMHGYFLLGEVNILSISKITVLKARNWKYRPKSIS